MEKIGYLEIRITGTKGNLELKPDTLDIRELMSVLEQSENLLFPNEKERSTNNKLSIRRGVG
ncbi:hypothetical protein ACFJIV_30995 [Mucilaginibacter sp. UC70_90]